MNSKLLASFKKLAVASVKADAQLAQGVKEVFDAFEAKAQSNATESARIKENISRGARLSKHRFTL